MFSRFLVDDYLQRSESSGEYSESESDYDDYRSMQEELEGDPAGIFTRRLG